MEEPEEFPRIANEFRDEEVLLPAAHPVDVRGERVVIAERHATRVVVVAANPAEVVRAAELGPFGVTDDVL